MSKAVELDTVSGEARLTFGGQTYVIEPPLLGQMRDLDRRAAELDAKARADAEHRAAEALKDDEDLDAETREALETMSVSASVVSVLPWWRRLFELCCDKPLPDDDDCPLWMGTTVLITRLQVHWQLHPFVGLGPPDLQDPTPAETR